MGPRDTSLVSQDIEVPFFPVDGRHCGGDQVVIGDIKVHESSSEFGGSPLSPLNVPCADVRGVTEFMQLARCLVPYAFVG